MDLKKMLRNLKLAQAKVRNTLDVYNPSKYPPEVVKASKDSWIKKAEDAFDIVAELSLDLEECVSPEEAREIFKSNDELKNAISKFVLATINMALSIEDLCHPATRNFVYSETQTKLDRIQFPTFPGNENEMMGERENQVEEEVHVEQSHKCLEAEPIRSSILDSTKKLSDASSAEIIQTPVENLMDVQSVLPQNQFNLASVDQRFRRHELKCGTVRSIFLKFPVHEMHVMLEFSGSIQRRSYCVLDYIKQIRSWRLWLLSRYVDSMSFNPSSVSTNANASFARS